MNFNNEDPLLADFNLVPMDGDQFWDTPVNEGDGSSMSPGAALSYVNSHDSYQGSVLLGSDNTHNPQFYGVVPNWWDQQDTDTAIDPRLSSAQGVKRENDDEKYSELDDHAHSDAQSSKKRPKTRKAFSRADQESRDILGRLNTICQTLQDPQHSATSASTAKALESELIELKRFVERTDMTYKPDSTRLQSKGEPSDVDRARRCKPCRITGSTCRSYSGYLNRWATETKADGTTTFVPQANDGEKKPPACESCKTQKKKCVIETQEGTDGTSSTTAQT